MLFLSFLLPIMVCLGCAQKTTSDTPVATGTVSMEEPIASLPWGTAWDAAHAVLELEPRDAPISSALPGQNTTQLTVEDISAVGLSCTAVLTFRIFTDAEGAPTPPLFTGLRLIPAAADGAKATLLQTLGLEESSAHGEVLLPGI